MSFCSCSLPILPLLRIIRSWLYHSTVFLHLIIPPLRAYEVTPYRCAHCFGPQRITNPPLGKHFIAAGLIAFPEKLPSKRLTRRRSALCADKVQNMRARMPFPANCRWVSLTVVSRCIANCRDASNTNCSLKKFPLLRRHYPQRTVL